jgi:hypothetical protein
MLSEKPPLKRAWVKFDKYLWDFCDDQQLSANERLVLLYIATETQWQDRTWTGSLVDISSRTKVGRKTARLIMERFVEKGLLECISSFKSNSIGIYGFAPYEILIIPELPKSGRPRGSKDSYQRQRTTEKGVVNEAQDEHIRNVNVTQSASTAQFVNPKNLMGAENFYKSPREAARSEVERESESSYLAENNDEVPEVLRSLDASPIQSGDNPCGICGDEKGPHIWATSDGSGHEWVPAKVTKFTDEELFEGM